ncbi:DUF2158 domain-containing protein [Pantoea agglomerans]|uniref:YodC family protein n=1 Tax=Enterobacter agglomerans TaxID=549 RepID=UPI0023B06AA2|nr:DUF2158 domain-containing protein [Pantoea agglomerans]WEC71181.1 DUF2158 domain-containing protein [Pantoea agglomerans]
MASKFANGTVVQLKSGGPLMTVSYYKPDSNEHICMWFKDSEVKSSYFEPEVLREVKEDNGVW